MIGVVKYMWIRSDYGVIGWGYSNGCVQNCAEVYQGDEIRAMTGLLVLEWFLKEGPHEYFELMLQRRIWEEKIDQVR